MARDNIRNFCIIAHIDHGKSTLSDRILELTKSVDERIMEDQILDNMDIERERGITIKARAVTLNYTAKDGKTYEFNLIDTPGHVDFAYEVSRSLAACEGAILVVDATQGVEAQTLANTYMALEHDLELVPILNKIDLPSAHPDEVAQEVEDVIGLPCMDAPRVSAKTGLNVDQVLERVVSDIPAPTGDPDAPLKALIFDSIYDSYKGVIVYIRVFEGSVKPGDTSAAVERQGREVLSLKTRCAGLEEELFRLLRAVEQPSVPQTQATYVWTVKARRYSIAQDAILYFESRSKKTFLVTAAQEYELSASLDALEEQLGSRFVRTHRSYLVNQRHILSYDAGTMTVTLDDESVVYLSRTGKARLKEALAW